MPRTVTLREGEITVTSEEVNKLDALVNDMPTKFGLQIINIFRGIHQRNQIESVKPEPEDTKGSLSVVPPEQTPEIPAPQTN
jgi:hypothetical protein